MLSLVLAASNSPVLTSDVSDWSRLHEAQRTEGVPHSPEYEKETPDVIAMQSERIQSALRVLRARLTDAAPDALVILGYDDGTCFGPVQTPQFCTFTGEHLEGASALAILGEDPHQDRLSRTCAAELAWRLHGELVERDIDISYMSVQNPLGQPEAGMSSAFIRPLSWLPGDIPIIPIFINCRSEPTPTGDRCWAFGTALGEAIDDLTENVAVLAVGGMSHDPHGPRAGWIDERLDRFFLEQLRLGRAGRLRHVFNLDSDAVRGGTAQLRTWLAAGAVAARKGSSARIVEYLPSYHAMAGLGFAYWSL